MMYLATQNGLTSHCYKLDISNQSVYLWQIYWPKHSTCDKLQDYSQYTQVCGWKVRKILRHSGHKFVDSATFVSTWGFRFLVFYELCPNQPPLAWKNIIDIIHFIWRKKKIRAPKYHEVFEWGAVHKWCHPFFDISDPSLFSLILSFTDSP